MPLSISGLISLKGWEKASLLDFKYQEGKARVLEHVKCLLFVT